MSQPDIRCTIKPARNGAAAAPLIVLGPSLGTTAALWANVVPALTVSHRVLCFDLPGHGSSPTVTESFTIEELADALLHLVDSIGVDTFDYAGISLGGAIGLSLAANHPERLVGLVVLCSGARIGTPGGWVDRACGVRAGGTASLVAGSAARWFAPDFLRREPQASAHALAQLPDIDDESYALACEALSVFDLTDGLAGIRSPVLCVSGEFDTVTSTAQLQDLAARIPGARAVELAGVAHLPSLERPTEVGALLGEWLAARSTGSVTLPAGAPEPVPTDHTAASAVGTPTTPRLEFGRTDDLHYE